MAKFIQVDGRVLRIYPDEAGSIHIRLDNPKHTGQSDPHITIHKKQYFTLNNTHLNYQVLYTLLLTAAANKWKIRIRCEDYPDLRPSWNIRYIIATPLHENGQVEANE
jgi:hypothetical protein